LGALSLAAQHVNSLENGRGRSIGWAVRRLPEEESSGGAAHVHEWIVYEEERSCVVAGTFGFARSEPPLANFFFWVFVDYYCDIVG